MKLRGVHPDIRSRMRIQVGERGASKHVAIEPAGQIVAAIQAGSKQAVQVPRVSDSCKSLSNPGSSTRSRN